MSSSFCCWCSWTRWGLMMRDEVDATLYGGCGIWEHLRSFWEMNLSRVVLRLYGYVYKIWRLTNIKVEFSVVVVGVDFRSWITQFVSGGRPLFDSRFTKFVLRSSGSIKFVMLFQDSNTDGSSSVTTRIEYLFALQF